MKSSSCLSFAADLYTNTLFMTLAWIRGFCIFLVTYNAMVMALERILSTIFIKDYEAKPRIYIPVILITIEVFCSFISMILFYKGNFLI